MEGFNKILNNELYKGYIKENEISESGREYCLHDLQHLIDVARIAYILNLEEGYGFNKDTIYAAALLHDIGKWKQYRFGAPHEVVSAYLAEEILIQCGYAEDLNKIIMLAISEHRHKNCKSSSLGKLLYRADKLSRKCYSCKVEDSCYWDQSMKNIELKY